MTSAQSPTILYSVRFRTAIVASMLLCLLWGCSPVHYGVFINTLNEDLTLEISQLSGGKVFDNLERYILGAGHTKKAVCLIAQVVAKDSSGRVLFNQVLPSAPSELKKFQKPGERKVCYLSLVKVPFPFPSNGAKAGKSTRRRS